jgi:hydroxyacid-oxoacid transhydrogenase
MTRESAFEMAVSSIRFGPGVTREVGMDLKDLGIRTALVFIDPNLRHLAPAAIVLESLEDNGIKAVAMTASVLSRVMNQQDAIAFARESPHDGFVALGGGSTMDTAKAVNSTRRTPRRFSRLCEPADR